MFDVIVVGGGHAGCEAASAAARMGACTALITPSKDNLGEMSCNPSIGGIGKGTLVKEIDALGGIMGLAIDQAGIHYKMLNRSKGAAVWGPRAQADRKLYKRAVQALLSAHANLTIIEGSVEDITLDSQDRVRAVALSDGQSIEANTIIITTGTFLSGVIHIGTTKHPAGRWGEQASYGLAATLRKFALQMGRLNTGTPPRLDGRTINYDKLEVQLGDEIPEPFSYTNEKITVPQIACYLTRTNAASHDVVIANLDKTAVYSGNVTAKGPRYCPSIEDKMVRFPDKTSHQIFLEPEGLDDFTIYPNGLSTSLPPDLQQQLVRSIKGLEQAEILRFGYDIEYDFVDPRELYHSLEVKKIHGLFLAGQVNGTTGYEEAAAQGIIAGLNAALHSQGRSPITMSRAESYIGVLIDDLVTKGVVEPYRMFTSRAEYRLSLRSDNADLRLTPLALELDCITSERKAIFQTKQSNLADLRKYLHQNRVKINDTVYKTLYELLATDSLPNSYLQELSSTKQALLSLLAIEAKYAGYLIRQHADITLFKQEESQLLPRDLDYSKIPSLSIEVVERLQKIQPENIAVLKSISGITPAAVVNIIVYLKHKYSKAS